MTIEDEDAKPQLHSPEAADAITYAEACRMFLDVIRAATVASKATDLNDAEKARFAAIATSASQRMQREIDPRYLIKGPNENVTTH